MFNKHLKRLIWKVNKLIIRKWKELEEGSKNWVHAFYVRNPSSSQERTTLALLIYGWFKVPRVLNPCTELREFGAKPCISKWSLLAHSSLSGPLLPMLTANKHPLACSHHSEGNEHLAGSAPQKQQLGFRQVKARICTACISLQGIVQRCSIK